TIAAKRNEAALALKLWDGLAAPATMNAAEWQLTLARMSLQAGEAEASKSTIERLLAGRTAASAELAQSILELAQEMLDLRALDAAETVFELMIPIVPESRAREVLFGLARTQELRGDWIAAAGSYLRSALLAQGGATDALASQGRLIAGLNLTRAGLKNDARAQFEWILKNTKEPDLVEAARRGLRRL
ncbi:MAG: tetratricopeptide repeat protein, partial [Burkholderiales bacterium]